MYLFCVHAQIRGGIPSDVASGLSRGFSFSALAVSAPIEDDGNTSMAVRWALTSQGREEVNQSIYKIWLRSLLCQRFTLKHLLVPKPGHNN